MKIALFGADGFVGRNVETVLTAAEIPFSSVSRKKGVDLRDNLNTLDWLREHKPEIIINCAAHVGSLNYVTQLAATIIADNAKMIMSMYEAIALVCPDCIVINPIANCVYPAVDEKFQEDDIWKGPVHASVFAYGGSRRFLLMIAKAFEMQHAIKSIQLVVPNMYGPFDSTDPNKAHALNALLSRFVKAECLQVSSITLWGTGVAIREWLYAEDFGKIILSIIKNPHMIGLSEPINIAQNFGLSVKELVLVIQRHFSQKFSIKWDTMMPDGAPKKVMDDRRFEKVFPTFNFTDLDIGIKKTINYYKSIYPY